MDTKMNGGEENRQVDTVTVIKVPDRLLKRDQARIQDVERKKEAKEIQSVTEERGEFFSSTFNRERAVIDELLYSCSVADRGSATQTLERVTAQLQQLQKFVNDSIVFLTAYELRQAQASLQNLQVSLAEKRDEALPQKKFAFRSRTKAKADGAMSDTTPALIVAHANISADSVINQVDGTVTSKQCGFSNMDSVVLTKTAEEIHKNDVLLTHLTNCKVRLFGSPSTLHIRNVSGCEILCGPVSSSVFVDYCSNSTLAFPCQQLRTHNTTNTQVYLHVTSRAIIEYCSEVSFAPFTWSYPTLDQDFSVSGLDRNQNNWSEVDDFNWLAAGTQSPNWCIIPEEHRKTSWDS